MNLCRQMSRLGLGLRSVRAARLPAPAAAHAARYMSSVTLPANVTMEEGLKVFEREPVMDILPMEMLFPPLSVDKSIKVHKFQSPGEFAEEEASMNPVVFGVAIR
jgi:hypothetical protein